MIEARHTLVARKTQIDNCLLDLFSRVMEAMDQALSCLADGDRTVCRTIIEGDAGINNCRCLIERDCLTTIALHQPVASDLREVIAASRVAGELERMGDYASDIASIVMQMDNAGQSETGTVDVLKISRLCARMLDEVQAAYRQKDAGKAKESAKLDDVIDSAHANLVNRLFSTMQSSPGLVPDASRTLWISHILERYADHATNIAEQVVFMTEGELVELN